MVCGDARGQQRGVQERPSNAGAGAGITYGTILANGAILANDTILAYTGGAGRYTGGTRAVHGL